MVCGGGTVRGAAGKNALEIQQFSKSYNNDRPPRSDCIFFDPDKCQRLIDAKGSGGKLKSFFMEALVGMAAVVGNFSIHLAHLSELL